MPGWAHVTAAGDVLAGAAALLLLHYVLAVTAFAPRWAARWAGRFAALLAILPALRLVVVSGQGDGSVDPGMLGAGLLIFSVAAMLAVIDAPLLALLRRIARLLTPSRR
jgi:hypothetical protein